MRKVFRVIYPILIYTGITFVTAFLAMLGLMVYSASQMLGSFNSSQSMIMDVMNRYYSNILFITFLSALFTIPILVWIFKRDQRYRGIDQSFSWKFPKYWIYLIGLGISACIVGNNLITVSGIQDFLNGYEEVSEDIFGASLWLQIVGVGIIIPITEELVFRALGFRRMRDYMRFGSAAIISSLCFAVFHGNIVQGIYAFGLGLLMAFCYEQYDSVIAPILFHCAANLASVVLTTAVGRYLLYSNVWVSVIVTLVMLMLLVWFIIRMKKDVLPQRAVDPEEVIE